MRVSKHIEIMPNGNKRQAQNRGMEKASGYSHGISPEMTLYYMCRELDIEEMSFYGFTVDNTRRPTTRRQTFTEVRVATVGELSKEDTSLLISGNTQSDMFPPGPLPYATRQNFGAGEMKINFLVNHSQGWDLGFKPGPRASGEPTISRLAPIGPGLKTADVSRTDLTIRWGGRRRLSGFFPMQSVHSDICMVDDYWPDFRRQHVGGAIRWYSTQDVTLGG